jgi:thiamine biosynthesis lipoprotein
MPHAELRFEAIGAPWRIDTPDPLTADIEAAIRRRIDEFDKTYSRFRHDSLVSRIARKAGSWEFPDDAGPLFDLYERLYGATDGAVNPLVGERLEHLGYDAAYSLRPSGVVKPIPRWEDAIAWDGERLTTVAPVVLDVGAAGKGYLVDLVAGVLEGAGIRQYTIDASGDILHRGAEPLRIALEHPFDPTLAIGVYELTDGALCASAPNRRSWGDGLHHIIDAVTGDPTVAVAATWAIASSALVADGLATALFFASAASLAAEFDFDYVRMFPNSRVEHSLTFQGELFT